MLDEEAKAVQEIAKTTKTALEKSGDLGAYVTRTFGDLQSELVGVLTDKAQVYRAIHRIKLSEEFCVELKKRGIRNPKAVSPSFLIPYLDAATLVEDDELRAMWVCLLVNAADPSAEFNVSKFYIDILKQMGPLEAQCLQVIAQSPNSHNEDLGVWTADLPDRVHDQKPSANHDECLPAKDVTVALNNLGRLGCINTNLVWDSRGAYSVVVLTPLGAALVESCSTSKLEDK